MKKILIVVPDSLLGGITASAKNLVHLLHAHGHSVTLLNLSHDDSGFTDVGYETNRLYLHGMARHWQLGQQDVQSCTQPLKKLGLGALGLIKKVTIRCGLWYRLIFVGMKKLRGFDAVLAFRQCEPCYYFALHKVEAARTIGFIHGEKKYMVGDFSSWDKYFKYFDSIACVSDHVRGEFAEAYPKCADKFHCVYNSFDIESIQRKAEATPAVEMRANVTRLVTIARIVNPIKQIHFIPTICRRLLDSGFDSFHWYVIGDGPDLEADKALAQELGVADYITFTGMQDNPFPLLKAADLYVGTSKSEAYSMTIKEAHILGIPVLSTNYTTAYEAILHNENGYLTDNTAEGLANGLQELLQHDAALLHTLQEKTRSIPVTNDVPYDQLMQLID